MTLRALILSILLPCSALAQITVTPITSSGGAPGGAAGGDLAGTYPDPTIKPSVALTTPNIGAATATTVNKITITVPATGATLTISNGKTATFSNTITIAGTDGSTLNIGGGGTLGSNAFTSTAFAPLASPTFTGTVTVTGASTLTDATNIALGTGTGTQLGTAANQKLGHYGATPVVQQATDPASAMTSYGLLPVMTGTGGTSYGIACPVPLYAKGITVGTSGSPADIATINVPPGITRYTQTPGSSSNGAGVMVYAETAAGTLAGASFQIFDGAGGTGNAFNNGTNGPAAAGAINKGSASGSNVVSTSGTLYVRQTANSANAGTVTVMIYILPIP